jgi:phytoene synthase
MDAVAADDAPLASFETKWAAAHPEFALALRFVAEPVRHAQAAFACLVYELEHAAFAARDAQPAAAKLQWWAEEAARAGRHEARHPLMRVLADHAGFSTIPFSLWYETVAGALAQRDAEPAADREALLGGYLPLYRPLGTIEATLFPSVDAAAAARRRCLARALRETASVAEVLRDGRLPLPLDLMARHRLSRGDLAHASPAQAAALREWLAALEAEHGAARRVRSGPLAAAGLYADRWRARKAARAQDPLAELATVFGRLPLGTAWAVWRAAQRSPA